MALHTGGKGAVLIGDNFTSQEKWRVVFNIDECWMYLEAIQMNPLNGYLMYSSLVW